jgi:hypothetical protein
MSKRKKATGGVILADRLPDDSDERATARAVLRPTVGAAIATQSIYGTAVAGELLDVGALAEELSGQVGKVQGGDLGRVEAVLVAQLHTLDALANRLIQRAMTQEYLKQYETFLRLALKAQAQARATAEAIAEIRNPRPAVAFVRQANVGQNVQVNNEIPAQYTQARAHGKVEIAQDGLLGADDGGERLDTGAASQASRGDPTLATVDALDRADDRGR